MSEGREINGRFAVGNRANPNGRPRNTLSINETILREMEAPVVVTENNKRRKITKLEANAKQIANQGATGNLRAAKLTMDIAFKAHGAREAPAAPPPLTKTDREIVERFIARLSLTLMSEKNDDSDA